MGTETVVSLAAARRTREEQQRSPVDMSLDTLLRQAHVLRHAGSDPEGGMTVVTNKAGLADWFRRHITEAVLVQCSVSHNMLVSVPHAANVLAGYAYCGVRYDTLTESVIAYVDSGRPSDVLVAADTAFLMYALWPEQRTNRRMRYREFALEFGPSLYVNYADKMRQPFGYCMAGVFEPLGDIVRATCPPAYVQ